MKPYILLTPRTSYYFRNRKRSHAHRLVYMGCGL